MEKQKLAVAMSGGVDSSAAAVLAKGAGDAFGATMRLCDEAFAEAGAAAEICASLGMPHTVWDFRDTFRREVMERFAAAYAAGQTPNPCVVCNRFIKFGAFLERALQSGAARIVTGHYARTVRQGGRVLLQKAADKSKDQSYVLYTLSKEALERVWFPLGELTKPQVRELAHEQGLASANRKESQDICFVPDGDYAAFIERFSGKTFPPGDFTDLSGRVLGRHRGIIRYTVGQRRGLGLALPAPMYVVKKDVSENCVRLGFSQDLLCDTVEVGELNLTACDAFSSPVRLAVRIRYNQAEQPATVEQTGADRLRIRFDTPQRAVTPGQAAVLYDGDTVVGGGTIL